MKEGRECRSEIHSGEGGRGGGGASYSTHRFDLHHPKDVRRGRESGDKLQMSTLCQPIHKAKRGDSEGDKKEE